MNCEMFRERIPELFDRLPADPALHEHAKFCAACRAEWTSAQGIVESMTAREQFRASSGFTERVMQKAIQNQPRRWHVGWLAAAAAAVLILIPVWQTMSTERPSPAALLAQSMSALSDIRSVHMTGYMRSPAGEPFEFVDPQSAPVPITIWKEYGSPERWRIEKPGRVVVNDGHETLLLISNRMASRGGVRAGFVEWLRPLLSPDRLLGDEMARIRLDGSQAAVKEDGNSILLSVRRAPAGNNLNGWLRNKLIIDSDHTCRYRFDKLTKRLIALTVTVSAGGVEIEVLSLSSIEYNAPTDPAVFTLPMPEHVTWSVDASEMPVRGPLPSNAKETAELFFRGLAQEDWQAVLTVYPASDVPSHIRRAFGGIEVISLGEPFQVPVWGGWFVPYEIRFPNGHTKKWNLAVRNDDNPERRWKVDGGY